MTLNSENTCVQCNRRCVLFNPVENIGFGCDGDRWYAGRCYVCHNVWCTACYSKEDIIFYREKDIYVFIISYPCCFGKCCVCGFKDILFPVCLKSVYYCI